MSFAASSESGIAFAVFFLFMALFKRSILEEHAGLMQSNGFTFFGFFFASSSETEFNLSLSLSILAHEVHDVKSEAINIPVIVTFLPNFA